MKKRAHGSSAKACARERATALYSESWQMRTVRSVVVIVVGGCGDWRGQRRGEGWSSGSARLAFPSRG